MYVLKPPCLDFLWNSPIITSHVIVIVQVLTNRCMPKFETENQQFCMVQPMVTSNRDPFFKKRFSKPDFLKTVLVTIIGNSHITPPYGFCISSAFPVLISHTYLFKKTACPTQFCRNFISLFKKSGGTGRGQRIMCIHQIIYIIMFDSVCVLLLQYF